MKRILQGMYGKEFWEEAVNHVIEQGLLIPYALRHLDVSMFAISHLLRAGKFQEKMCCNRELVKPGYFLPGPKLKTVEGY